MFTKKYFITFLVNNSTFGNTHLAVLKPVCNNYNSVSNAIHHHPPLRKKEKPCLQQSNDFYPLGYLISFKAVLPTISSGQAVK